MKKSSHVELVVSHHGLILLIVSYNLAQQQSSWEELIVTIDGGLALLAPKRKHATSTSNRPLKRRKYVRLAWTRGRLENSQGNTGQLVEIDDLGDEQPL